MTKEELKSKMDELNYTDKLFNIIEGSNLVYLSNRNDNLACPDWLRVDIRSAIVNHYSKTADELHIESKFKSYI